MAFIQSRKQLVMVLLCLLARACHADRSLVVQRKAMRHVLGVSSTRRLMVMSLPTYGVPCQGLLYEKHDFVVQ